MVAATKLGAAPAPGFIVPEEPRQAQAIPEQPRQPSLEQEEQPASSSASQAAIVEEAVPSVAVPEPGQEDARPVQKNTSRCFCCNKKVREASSWPRVPRASLFLVWPNCQDAALPAQPQCYIFKCRKPTVGSQTPCLEVVTSWCLSACRSCCQRLTSMPIRAGLLLRELDATLLVMGAELSQPPCMCQSGICNSHLFLHVCSAGGPDRLQVPRLRLHILRGAQNTRGSPLRGA